MVKVILGENEKEVELIGEREATINGKEYLIDLAQIEDNAWNLIVNNQSHNVRLVAHDKSTKTVTLLINNRTYTAKLRDRFDELLDKMGMSIVDDSAINELKAPMPGLVVDLIAKPGDAVEKGDTLLILEAMKMENAIKAVGSATLKTVHVEKGQSVEKNQLLMSFE